MTERITDEQIDGLLLRHRRARRNYTADTIEQLRAERDDARLHAADFAAEAKQLRARVEEFEENVKKLVAYNTMHFNRVRELGDRLQNDMREAEKQLYNLVKLTEGGGDD